MRQLFYLIFLNPNLMNSIEDLWDALLSRDPERIQKTYRDLSESDRKAVVDHLIKMGTEDGWHSTQKQSAQIALDAFKRLAV